MAVQKAKDAASRKGDRIGSRRAPADQRRRRLGSRNLSHTAIDRCFLGTGPSRYARNPPILAVAAGSKPVISTSKYEAS
jgi:ribosomal protein L32